MIIESITDRIDKCMAKPYYLGTDIRVFLYQRNSIKCGGVTEFHTDCYLMREAENFDLSLPPKSYYVVREITSDLIGIEASRSAASRIAAVAHLLMNSDDEEVNFVAADFQNVFNDSRRLPYFALTADICRNIKKLQEHRKHRKEKKSMKQPEAGRVVYQVKQTEPTWDQLAANIPDGCYHIIWKEETRESSVGCVFTQRPSGNKKIQLSECEGPSFLGIVLAQAHSLTAMQVVEK